MNNRLFLTRMVMLAGLLLLLVCGSFNWLEEVLQRSM
jgi:hypothetical protein